VAIGQVPGDALTRLRSLGGEGRARFLVARMLVSTIGRLSSKPDERGIGTLESIASGTRDALPRDDRPTFGLYRACLA